MVNTALLEKAISDSGLKKKYIAKELGMTEVTFKNKRLGKSQFLGEEITNLCNILGISNVKQKSDIFLC